MATSTYKTRVIVLRKTKLGESDLILTMLAEDGSQLRAVAKGARKPQSSFSSRLELYCVSDIMNARGKNLDIIKEARLVDGNDGLRTDLPKTSAAACMAELLGRITQVDLAAPRLFDLSRVALSALCRTPDELLTYITAAHLLKALAFAGLQPSLDICIECQQPIDLSSTQTIRFSITEGGVVCDACSHAMRDGGFDVQAQVLATSRDLLHATFDDILTMSANAIIGEDVLRLCQQWISVHVGSKLKSLRILLAMDAS